MKKPREINLTNLADATLQEIFDWAVYNLLKQNAKSEDCAGDCVYRGDTGLKCAAGWCISDDEWENTRNENGDWLSDYNVGYNWENINRVFDIHQSEEQMNLICNLQSLHDQFNIGAWKDIGVIKQLFMEFNLDFSILSANIED